MSSTTIMATQASQPIPYTANPLLLIMNDLMLYVQITFTWPITAGLLSIVLPLSPMRSGTLDEMAPTVANLWTIFLHLILIVAQTFFTLSLVPLAFVGLPLLYLLYIGAFIKANQWFSALVNGPRLRGLHESHPDCVKGHWPKYEHEKWVFINGVAVGNHWLQSNLDLLAMTFRRPVFGIHNQTRGIIFDVLECIIQRDLGFGTTDIRTAYAALADILSHNDIHKVVLILHSQGGIEGGLVLDWLYDTMAVEQLRKLEVYTFGNAANHWNAPVISSSNSSAHVSAIDSGEANGDESTGQRSVQHIEHYANEGDYVSKFGILHFRPNRTTPQQALLENNGSLDAQPSPGVTKLAEAKAATYPQLSKTKTSSISPSRTWTPSPKTPIERDELQQAQDNNRFFGRLFKRASSGHMLNQHYLDNIFQMQGVDPGDRSKGRVKDGNEFMDAEVDMDVFNEFDTVQAPEDSQSQVRAASGINGTVMRQIKELSRLWEYRNGGTPSD